MLARRSQQEYCFHLGQVKGIYPQQYFQVDINDLDTMNSSPSFSPRQLDVLQEVADLIGSRTRPLMPRRPANLFVFGMPGSGRTTLGKAIAEKFGMVFVSTAELISSDIAQGCERVAPGQVCKGESVPDTIMLRILIERLRKTDCRMCGYVLDGFPKTAGQFQYLGEGELELSLLVILQSDAQTCSSRLTAKYGGKMKGQELQALLERKQRRWQMIQERLEQAERRFAGQVLRINGKVPIERQLELITFRLQHS